MSAMTEFYAGRTIDQLVPDAIGAIALAHLDVDAGLYGWRVDPFLEEAYVHAFTDAIWDELHRHAPPVDAAESEPDASELRALADAAGDEESYEPFWGPELHGEAYQADREESGPEAWTDDDDTDSIPF
jgi:hypothetical protein